MSLERVLKALVGLGLSQTDAEVYVHLATAGPATAKSITGNLALNKRQIYRSLKALQQKGIASGTDEYPAENTALVNGEIAFRQHAGGHTVGPNWPVFFDYAARYFSR